MVFQRSLAIPLECIENALSYYCPNGSRMYPFMYNDIVERQRTLYNCMLTCRALVPRSRYLLFLHLQITSYHPYICLGRNIQHFKTLINCTREVTICDLLGSRKPCSQLFVHRFAHELLQLERLNIWRAQWAYTSLHESFFMSLRLLTSVTSLNLLECRFPSLHEFHRVLRALPALMTLELVDVMWENELSLETSSLSRARPYRPLHLDSLYVNELTNQMLAWFMRTTVCTSLCTLDVVFAPDMELSKLKPVLERLGPSLQSLDLNIWDYDPKEDNDFGLTNSTGLKSLTVRDVYITDVPDILASVTSTQLSTLTLNILYEMGEKMFDRSGWDGFLAALGDPVFKGIERVEIMLEINDRNPPWERRCVRRLCKMILEWLAPIEARMVVWVGIKRGWNVEDDGPYVEGDELVSEESDLVD